MKSSFKKMAEGISWVDTFAARAHRVHVHEYEMELFITVGVVFFQPCWLSWWRHEVGTKWDLTKLVD